MQKHWCIAIAKNFNIMAIGCEQHIIDEWISFYDEEIDHMDITTLEWNPTLKRLLSGWKFKIFSKNRVKWKYITTTLSMNLNEEYNMSNMNSEKEIRYVIIRSDGNFINAQGKIRSTMSKELLWLEKAVPAAMVQRHNHSAQHKYIWYLAMVTMGIEFLT